jgi:hypothetical protein
MKGSQSVWKWIIVALVIVLLVPIFVVLGGVLLVTPVRRQTTPLEGGEHAVVVVEQVADPTLLAPLANAPNATRAPARTSHQPTTPASAQGGATALLSLDPWNPVNLLLLPILAGLVVLAGAAVIVGVEKRWRASAPPVEDAEMNGDTVEQQPWWEKLRFALLAFAFWLALSILLVLDLAFGVSVYLQFLIIYAAFWLLVGALLLIGRPLREKLLILGLFLALTVSIRFVDWNSRKPFLKDFQQVGEGMTEQEVDQIMDGYMKSYSGGPPPSMREYEPEYDEQGQIVQGWIAYRHTIEGWGDSDWGVITFEDRLVVGKRFLPD